jgi:UDP-N-acetylmuramate--alanine ligase
VEDGYFTFDYQSPAHRLEGLQLSLPGRHNVENATAAITVALQLGGKGADIRRALRSFRGIRRRFEFLHRSEGRAYIDDYAHHPEELQAAIGAAKELFPDREVTGIFQPHLFSRTRDFVDGFARALEQLDEIWLMDIYPAREAPIPGVDSAWLFDKIDHPRKHLVQAEEVLPLVKERQPKVLLTLGAGDIDLLRNPLKDYFGGKA